MLQRRLGSNRAGASVLAVIIACQLAGCAARRNFTLAPVKTFDPDTLNIPEPPEREENQIWDIIDYTFVYQVEKILELSNLFRMLGEAMGLVGARQADNVNALDEVPNSSWFTNRHAYKRMSIEALQRGPNTTDGPDTSGTWTIVRGKFEGGTPGFTIRDPRGDMYILKFDAPRYPEMGSSAEVISTKILYACGYNVPQNSIAYFHPDSLRIGETAQVNDQGLRRPMTRADIERMLAAQPRKADGRIRCLASKFVDGKPVGVWNYRGRRNDDPNDLVDHQHRRELRGLRVISSWLSDEDRRAANTLAVYTGDPQTGGHYIKHYLIDMGSTLGSNNVIPHAPKYGNEYLVDPRTIARSLFSLGFYVKPWEFEGDHLNPRYPSVGYYESEIFNPGAWYPTYPNPAFENMTLRDAFWGAKIVTAFTDAEIEAIVKTAQMTDPAAEAYLIRTLIERRDKIGRYWFARINPLDRFTLHLNRDGYPELGFTDLAVARGLASAESTHYVYETLSPGNEQLDAGMVDSPVVPLRKALEKARGPMGKGTENGPVDAHRLIVSLRIRRGESGDSKYTRVHLYIHSDFDRSRVLGIERQE